MQRLAQFDVSRQFLSPKGKLTAQVVFGGLCACAMIGLRSLFDLWAPTSGPFALIYPTVLLATFYGHWRAGVAAFFACFAWAWYFVLPAPSSFTLVDPSDGARVALNAFCCLVVIVFAEAFRRAAHSTMAQIREAADRRLTLLAELEHRTKNNFALVASMLDLQRRRVDDPQVQAPLIDAVGRVRTFAEAYSNLSMEQVEDGEVDVKLYLDVMLDRIAEAAFPPNVTLFREIDRMMLPREVAVAIGLYLNEAVSNCLKYAFPDGREGTVGIYFHARGEAWMLSIDDNGVGKAAPKDGNGGLGITLMTAFAQQAGATHSSGPVAGGYRAQLGTLVTSEV